ncbi:MAG: iron-sulfur cluster assembly scaffold protein [Desulfobacterales bacterium]|nr:iron-sulfur cluster assembly scaffold protein [Desulfobacterales bacterium]
MNNINTQAIENEKKALAEIGYGANAIKYYIEKPYMGDLPDADHISEMVGTCGDTMKIYLKFDNEKIADARYQVLGCAGAVSAAMAIAEALKGKTVEEAKEINDGHIFNILENIPEKKHHCIQLAVKTMHKAIDEYQNNITYENSEPLKCDKVCDSDCCSKNTIKLPKAI